MKAEKRVLVILTIVNIILLLLIAIVYYETSRNLQMFNSTDNTFDYEETGEGKVVLTLAKDERVTIVFHRTDVEIAGAYRYTDKTDMVKMIRFIRYYCERHGFNLEKCNSDLWGEMRLHTALYEVGYKRLQTGNANLDFESDKRWYVNAVGSVLGWIGI